MEFNQQDITIYFINLNTFLQSVKEATGRLVNHDLVRFDGVLEKGKFDSFAHKGFYYNFAILIKRYLSIYNTF
jgi:hypothetical protein